MVATTVLGEGFWWIPDLAMKAVPAMTFECALQCLPCPEVTVVAGYPVERAVGADSPKADAVVGLRSKRMGGDNFV
jgi:hypothetical protein